MDTRGRGGSLEAIEHWGPRKMTLASLKSEPLSNLNTSLRAPRLKGLRTNDAGFGVKGKHINKCHDIHLLPPNLSSENEESSGSRHCSLTSSWQAAEGMSQENIFFPISLSLRKRHSVASVLCDRAP